MAKNVLVKYKRPSLYRVGDFRIIGGINEVRREVWDAVKENPGVKKRLESGDIVLMDIKPADRPHTDKKVAAVGVGEPANAEQASESEYPLKSLNVKDAKALIKETYDFITLKRWVEVEERQSVILAIEKQLEDFAPPEKDEKKNADSES